VAVVRHTFTYKQHTEYRERNIHNNKKKKFGKCRTCPVFVSYTLTFALQLRKKHRKNSVRGDEICPSEENVFKKYRMQFHFTLLARLNRYPCEPSLHFEMSLWMKLFLFCEFRFLVTVVLRSFCVGICYVFGTAVNWKLWMPTFCSANFFLVDNWWTNQRSVEFSIATLRIPQYFVVSIVSQTLIIHSNEIFCK
jgi:hypothetical protein